MAKIRTPDDHARQVLFNHNNKELAALFGTKDSTTVRRRRERPGTLRLDELAAIVKEDGITAEELYMIVMERGRLTV